MAHHPVKHAVVVGLLAFAAGVALYPWLTTELASRGAGQRVQSYSPQSHMVKMGTPTMGGILFCAIESLLRLDSWRAL